MKETKITIPTSALGYPGVRGILFFDTSEGPAEKTKKIKVDDKVRSYEASVFLSRDIEITSTEFSREGGDSYLAQPAEGGKGIVEYRGEKIEMTAVKNNEGRIAKFLFPKLHANNHVEAISKAKRSLLPFLSSISFFGDVPVIIDRIQIVDLETAQFACEFIAPYQDKQLNPGSLGIHTLLKPVFALYREAKSSSSQVYRFLCYVKIMEGLYRSVRRKVNSLAKESGISLKDLRKNEIVPKTGDFVRDESPLIGRKIGEVFQTVLEPKYRHAIAHFELDASDPIDFDETSFVAELENLIPFIEQMVRVLINNEIQATERLIRH